MVRIHHNTIKKAQRFGFALVEQGALVVVMKNGKAVAKHEDAKTALELAINAGSNSIGSRVRKLVDRVTGRKPKVEADEDEDEGEEAEETEGASVVKRRYKERYKPFEARCGDDLSLQITSHVTMLDRTGKPRVDTNKLREFAEINEVWVPSYGSLNPGMQRMNVANRLRTRVRKGFKVYWS